MKINFLPFFLIICFIMFFYPSLHAEEIYQYNSAIHNLNTNFPKHLAPQDELDEPPEPIYEPSHTTTLPPPANFSDSPPSPPPGYVPPNTQPSLLPRVKTKPPKLDPSKTGFVGTHAATPALEPFENLKPPPDYPFDLKFEKTKVKPDRKLPDAYIVEEVQTEDFRPLVTEKMAEQIRSLMRTFYTFRNLIDEPTDDTKLRKIYNIGKLSSEMLGLMNYPPITRFVAGHRDSMVYRDRSESWVEYREYGGFDNRLSGIARVSGNSIYFDFIFQGRGKRRNHIRAQISKKGTYDGVFYAHGWDKYGHIWKIQCKIENVFTHSDGLPASGNILLQGADPAGNALQLELEFPVKVIEAKNQLNW